MDAQPPEKRSREEVLTQAAVRTTRSKAASSLLMVYEYVTSRELKLLKNVSIANYEKGKLTLGKYTLQIKNTTDGRKEFTFLHAGGHENIIFKSLSAKQLEAATVLTSEIPNDLIQPSVQKHAYYIEKFCVFLDSVLPIKLLLAVAAKMKGDFKLEVDELAALFSNMGESKESSDEMSVVQQIDEKVDAYITTEIFRIREAAAIEQYQPPPRKDVKMKKSRSIPKSFGIVKPKKKQLSFDKTDKTDKTVKTVINDLNKNNLKKVIDKTLTQLTSLKTTLHNFHAFYSSGNAKLQMAPGNARSAQSSDREVPVHDRRHQFLDLDPQVLAALGQIKGHQMAIQNAIPQLLQLQSNIDNKDNVPSSQYHDIMNNIKSYMFAMDSTLLELYTFVKYHTGNIDWKDDDNYIESVSTHVRAGELVDDMSLLDLRAMQMTYELGEETKGGRVRKVKKTKKTPKQSGGYAYFRCENYIKASNVDYSSLILECNRLLEKTQKSNHNLFLQYALAEINIRERDRGKYLPIEAMHYYNVLQYQVAYKRAEMHDEGIEKTFNNILPAPEIAVYDDCGLLIVLTSDLDNILVPSHSSKIERRLSETGQGLTSKDGKQRGGTPTEEQKYALANAIARYSGIPYIPADVLGIIASHADLATQIAIRVSSREGTIAVPDNKLVLNYVNKFIKNIFSQSEEVQSISFYEPEGNWASKLITRITKPNNTITNEILNELKNKDVVSIRVQCSPDNRAIANTPEIIALKAALKYIFAHLV